MLTVVDAKTGERLHQERLGGVYSASPVAGDGKVYLVSEDGETIVPCGGLGATSSECSEDKRDGQDGQGGTKHRKSLVTVGERRCGVAGAQEMAATALARTLGTAAPYELWLGWATLEGAGPGGVPYTGFSGAVQEDRGRAAVHLGSWESGKAHLNEEITQCPELCKASVR